MSSPFESFHDEPGSAKVVHLLDPASSLRAVLVIDNVACGPSIGGVRMASDVSTEELSAAKRETGSVTGMTAAERITPAELFAVPDFIANAGGVICASVESTAARKRRPSTSSGRRFAGTPRK